MSLGNRAQGDLVSELDGARQQAGLPTRRDFRVSLQIARGDAHIVVWMKENDIDSRLTGHE